MADADPKVEGETPTALRRVPATPLASVVAVLATIIGLILLAWTILYVTKGRFLKDEFESFVSKQTQRQVKVAGDFQLYLNPIDIKFLAEGLTISNPEWASKDNFFESKLIDTRIATIPLIFGTRRIDWLSLVDGDIDLEWNAEGTRNTWTFGETKGEPLELPTIRRATVEGSDLRYRDPRNQLSADISFETVRAADTRFESDIRFSGGGEARGNPFTIRGSLMSPNETVSGGRNQLELHAQSGRTFMDVSGTLPGATEIEGANLKMGVRGPNIAELFSFLGIAVPETRAYRITSALTKQGDEWRFTGMKGRFGDSDISGRLTIRPIEPRMQLNADLRSDTVDIVDVGPWIGYDPDRLEAQGAQGAVTQVGGTPRVLPDAPLRVEALRNFDARVDYRIRRVRAESFPVSNILIGLTLDNMLLNLSPLNFEMARGTVSSDIEINARGTPVRTEYDIRLSPTPMGRLLAGFGVEESGTTGTLKARVQLTGEGDTVRDSLATSDGRIAIIMPAGTMWARNTELSELDIGTFIWKMWQNELKEPVQINCGLIAFTVRDGIAAADPILIDTKKNVILGRGGFSFKNEAIDLRVRADGKKFSLFSAQSPVGLQGYFAEPSIDVISPQLIARGAAGIGLAAAASPLAGILAFIDIGDAEAAACGPVLSGARATAQREKDGDARDDVGRGTTAKSESGKQSGEAKKEQRKKFLGIF